MTTKKREPVWTWEHAPTGRCEIILRRGEVVGYIDTHHWGKALTDKQLELAAKAACRALNAAEKKRTK